MIYSIQAMYLSYWKCNSIVSNFYSNVVNRLIGYENNLIYVIVYSNVVNELIGYENNLIYVIFGIFLRTEERSGFSYINQFQ
jgi:hypothetical protein